MSASSEKVISPLLLSIPASKTFCNRANVRPWPGAYSKSNRYLYNRPVIIRRTGIPACRAGNEETDRNVCPTLRRHFRTRQPRFELLTLARRTAELFETLAESVFRWQLQRIVRLPTIPHYVQTKLLLGMWYKAAPLAMASMDKPAILQRLRAALAEGAYCPDVVCGGNSA